MIKPKEPSNFGATVRQWYREDPRGTRQVGVIGFVGTALMIFLMTLTAPGLDLGSAIVMCIILGIITLLCMFMCGAAIYGWFRTRWPKWPR